MTIPPISIADLMVLEKRQLVDMLIELGAELDATMKREVAYHQAFIEGAVLDKAEEIWRDRGEVCDARGYGPWIRMARCRPVSFMFDSVDNFCDDSGMEVLESRINTVRLAFDLAPFSMYGCDKGRAIHALSAYFCSEARPMARIFVEHMERVGMFNEKKK